MDEDLTESVDHFDGDVQVGEERNNKELAGTPLKPLISVIVPIFNVEGYIRKCLDSLKEQTLKQIEVICIDDGSTDESGRIADEYVARKDRWPAFKIIHTENRGLSAARNRGIDEACAEWLMFVDSDDWVDNRFCQIPYEAAISNNADLVIFQINRWKNGKRQKPRTDHPFGLIDESVAHEYGEVGVWNKLYKKRLFDGIDYPEGRVYEDYATTHKVVHKAKNIVFLKDCLYNYTVTRKGSISSRRTESSERDRFVSMCERRDQLNQYGFPVEGLDFSLLGAALRYLFLTPPCDEDAYTRAKTLVTSCKGTPEILTWRRKIALSVWRFTPKRLYGKIGRRAKSSVLRKRHTKKRAEQ